VTFSPPLRTSQNSIFLISFFITTQLICVGFGMTSSSLSSPLRKKEKIGFGVTLSSPLRTCSPLRGFSPFSKIGSPLQGGKRRVENEGVGSSGGWGWGGGVVEI